MHTAKTMKIAFVLAAATFAAATRANAEDQFPGQQAAWQACRDYCFANYTGNLSYPRCMMGCDRAFYPSGPRAAVSAAASNRTADEA